MPEQSFSNKVLTKIRHATKINLLFVVILSSVYFLMGIGYSKNDTWENINEPGNVQFDFKNDNVYKYNQNTIISYSDDQVYNLWNLDIMDGKLNGNYGYNYTGKGVNIVIVDHYVYPHSDFKDRLHYLNSNIVHEKSNNIKRASASTDTSASTKYHGTECVGVMAGTTYGIAKDANIYHYALETEQDMVNLNKETTQDIVNLMKIETACSPDNKCVMLLPMGSYHRNTDYLDPIKESNSFIVVAPAGNDGLNLDHCVISYNPASDPDIISVGSFVLDSNMNYCRSPKSNYGKYIDIYAPGDKIISNGIDNQIVLNNGTSLAASHIAGIIACMLEHNHDMNIQDVYDIFSKMPIHDNMHIYIQKR